MHVEVKGTRLWFDVEGPALVPDGSTMRERPTVVLLHGGPGSFDHSYFKPDFARLSQTAQVVYLDLPGTAARSGATRRAGASSCVPTLSAISATPSVSPGRSSTGTPSAASSPWSTRRATQATPGRWCSSPQWPGSTSAGSSRGYAEPGRRGRRDRGARLRRRPSVGEPGGVGPLLEAVRPLGGG
jgi:pimeloyl-ACP methyl ester carboxylesterase